jgi:hypothetical protein
MLMSHNQDAGQNHNLLIATKSSENVAKCKYLGMTVKGKVVPVLNYPVTKTYPLLNYARHHVDVLREWRYSSMCF